MQYHEKGCSEPVYGYQYRRKPVYCVGSDRTYIAVESIEYVAVGVGVDAQPVRIDYLIKDIRLYIVIDVYANLCGYPLNDAVKQEAQQHASDGDADEKCQLFKLIARYDVNKVFAGNASGKAERRADDAEYDIEGYRSLIA